MAIDSTSVPGALGMPSTCSMQMVRSFAPGGSNVLSSRIWGSEFRVPGLGCWAFRGHLRCLKGRVGVNPLSVGLCLGTKKNLGGTFLGTCHGLLKTSLGLSK